jgi:hypothetical protein
MPEGFTRRGNKTRHCEEVDGSRAGQWPVAQLLASHPADSSAHPRQQQDGVLLEQAAISIRHAHLRIPAIGADMESNKPDEPTVPNRAPQDHGLRNKNDVLAYLREIRRLLLAAAVFIGAVGSLAAVLLNR